MGGRVGEWAGAVNSGRSPLKKQRISAQPNNKNATRRRAPYRLPLASAAPRLGSTA